ncbi:hypothetical protein LOY94_005182 [Ophidiomyces ophidiicola]|nr:hypothetical protein LOY92_005374 [Ophidiomyces ophidiicola]KAI2346358.1 hypothetical protein LOY94_005182 [Ophidiomyces ophidiicola]
MEEILIDGDTMALIKRRMTIAGGANGIGAATVSVFSHAGAHVFHYDCARKHGIELNRLLLSEAGPNSGSSTFIKADVADYEAQLRVFDAALDRYGTVDMTIYCAGIEDSDGWMAGELNLESVRKIPTPLRNVIGVNLTGGQPKSLTLISSLLGFTEVPGSTAYIASKHGIGIMRSLRATSMLDFNVRVNTICPWVTDTRMYRDTFNAVKKSIVTLVKPGEVGSMIKIDKIRAPSVMRKLKSLKVFQVWITNVANHISRLTISEKESFLRVFAFEETNDEVLLNSVR